jgi:hypothetical protein
VASGQEEFCGMAARDGKEDCEAKKKEQKKRRQSRLSFTSH